MAKNEEKSVILTKTWEKTQNQLITDVTREVIVQLAPQEVPLFRVTSEAYFKDPEKTLKGKKSKDEMLGFGIGGAVTILTPIALAVTTEVVLFVVEEVKKSIKEESSSLANDIVKKMFKRFRPAGDEVKQIPTLTSEQLAQVRRRACDKARQLNLPEAQAKLLADSLVGSLVL